MLAHGWVDGLVAKSVFTLTFTHREPENQWTYCMNRTIVTKVSYRYSIDNPNGLSIEYLSVIDHPA